MNAEAILAASYQRLMAGDIADAELALAEIWNAGDPKPTKAMHLLALIRRKQNRGAEAEALLREALIRAPRDIDMRVALAELLRAHALNEEAAKEYAAALALGPANGGAHLGYAFALIALGRGAEALGEARNAVASLPGSVDAARALAGAQSLQGRNAEALATIEAALDATKDAHARRVLALDRATALRRVGRAGDAIAAFEDLARSGPLAAAALAAWAQAYFESGDISRAEHMMLGAIEAVPGHAGLHKDIVNLRWMRGDAPAACLADLARAVAAAGDNHVLREAYAMAMASMGDLAGAERVLRDAIGDAPAHAPFYSALGYVQDERGAGPEAIATLALALSQGGDGETQGRYAHALMRAGDGARALREIDALLARAPHDQLARAYQATAWRMLGDPRFEELYDLKRFVGVYDLAPPPGFADMSAFNAALAARLDALHRLGAHPLNQTLREGTQTARDLTEEDDPIIQAFLAAARQGVRDFVAGLPNDSMHPFLSRKRNDVRYSGSWSVRLRAGGRHVNHVHPKGWISSAYYVRVPPKRANDSAHAGWLKFGEPRLAMPGCTPLHWVEPVAGRLVLFPSYMWHGTEPFDHDDRLTIAFDMVPA